MYEKKLKIFHFFSEENPRLCELCQRMRGDYEMFGKSVQSHFLIFSVFHILQWHSMV